MKNDGRNYSREVLERLRFRAIQLKKEGKEVNEIAYFFGVHRGSVSIWLTYYEREGKKGITIKKARGAEYKLSRQAVRECSCIL